MPQFNKLRRRQAQSMSRHLKTVICGAGIAGVAVAYYLSKRKDCGDILLIDKLQPLSLTTSKSGENYRDYWPQNCMNSFSSDSLDLMQALMDEHGDAFHMQDFGYQFVSRVPGREIFPGAEQRPLGVVSCTDSDEIHRRWPHLSKEITQTVGIERAGALDVYALGSLLLSQARSGGVRFQQGSIESLQRHADGFELQVAGAKLFTEQLVLTSGPFVADMAAQLGVDLPLENIAQRKFVIPDPAGVIPRDMPFTICADPLHLNWSEEERAVIGEDPAYAWLLEEFPPGLHIKPEGRDQIKLGWAFNRSAEAPRWDIPVDHDFPNLVVLGASQFVPGLEAYVDNLPTPVVQYAGYYTRTRENWPLIGPLDDSGLFAVAALSGYGTMTACAAGDLCARYMVGENLPAYARNFHPNRYANASVMTEINSLRSDGQL